MLIVQFRDTLPLLYPFFGNTGVGISPAPVFYVLLPLLRPAERTSYENQEDKH